MWLQWFNPNFTKLREYFVRKENKNDFIQQFPSSSASPWCHFGEYHIRKQHMLFCVSSTVRGYAVCCLHFDLNVNKVSMYICCLRMWYSPKWRQGEAEETKNCWIKSFLFSLRTKYSRSFVKLGLNHWSHMNYFNDVLVPFLSLDRVRILAVYGRVRELSEFINNILICVLKMNKGLTGLERHEGE